MALLTVRDEVARPFADGRRWNGFGAYEAVAAVAEFGVDPLHPANAGIVDLPQAPGRDGRVGFEADLRILRPQGGGNGRLLVVIPNRGLLLGVPFSAGASWQLTDPEALDPGDGHLLDQGWTIAWCGWQWDVPRGPGRLGLAAPVIEIEPGWMRVEFRPDQAQPEHALSDSAALFTFTDYPTADVDDPQAVLTRQLTPDGEPDVIARERWRFVDERTVALDGGFQAFHWYTLTYRTSLCPVAGAGLLAVRDAATWLRQQHGYRHVFAYGVSQSGRFLRQFLHEGRNVDEHGSLVFDGVFAHIAGGRRGEFNHRYAQPSLTHPLGFANLPPYDSAALLRPQRKVGAVPKVFLTNSSWEYWRGDGALVHLDPATGADLPDDPDVRAYLLSGTDHMGAVPLKELMPAANPVHTHDAGPILRALFAALVDWVCEGVEPPPSCVPRWVDGTAAHRADVLARFAQLPDVCLPDREALPVTRDIDVGPEADRGIGRWPYALGAAKPAVVSAIDATGNETAGIALPIVAAPVAAYTGWNPRRPVAGLPNPLYEFVGSRLPLLCREALAPREEYERAARAVADGLVSRRLLLPVDVERTVSEALAAYDAAARATMQQADPARHFDRPQGASA